MIFGKRIRMNVKPLLSAAAVMTVTGSALCGVLAVMPVPSESDVSLGFYQAEYRIASLEPGLYEDQTVEVSSADYTGDSFGVNEWNVAQVVYSADELKSKASQARDDLARREREAEEARLAAERKAAQEAAMSASATNTPGYAISDLAPPSWVQFGADGLPTNYSSYYDGIATAYSSGQYTSTGGYVYEGCVAVDPREIPYGTEMYIVSLDGKYVYGWCRAEDTGAFIHWTNGADVDVYIGSESFADEWGWRGVRIYFF